MLNVSDFEVNSGKEPAALDPVLEQLRSALADYLNKNPELSINGLSKKCSVSEPTLRRIYRGQVKTMPTVTTILDILSFISEKEKVADLMGAFPGPLADFISEKVEQVEDDGELAFSEHLSQALRDPIKYLIYKLSANPQGLDLEKVRELFGHYGEQQVQQMIAENLIYSRDNCLHARIESFALSFDVFVQHFKAVADFIKPHKHAQASRNYSPLFANYSSSVNKEAYSNILKVKRQALKRIRQILTDKNNQGPIPVFVLSAVDTLDLKSADEL
jgi:hypothetical protein